MKIISGGQTGADRTGLEVARELGIPTGGYAPLAFRTETGPDSSLKDYDLTETTHYDYRPRTRMNARKADGTVWFGLTGSPGYLCTAGACRDFLKPFIENPNDAQLFVWLRANQIRVLNVAGNRASTNPDVVAQVRSVLKPALELYIELEPKV